MSEQVGDAPNGTYLRVERELCPRILAPILSFPRCAREGTVVESAALCLPPLRMNCAGEGWG